MDNNLIWDHYLRRLSYEEFVDRATAPVDKSYIFDYIQSSIDSKDDDLLNATIVLAYKVGFDHKIADALVSILSDDWHRRHEEIIRILQFEVERKDIVDAVVCAIEHHHQYLYDMGDDESYIKQCLFLLQSLDTAQAQSAIEKLSKSENSVVRETAMEFMK